MQCKRDLTTNAISKYKARLNIHGGKQVFRLNYYDTYAPVVTWYAIRLLLILAVLYGWAYPQAPIEMDMYMELPQGIETR